MVVVVVIVAVVVVVAVVHSVGKNPVRKILHPFLVGVPEMRELLLSLARQPGSLQLYCTRTAF